MSARIAAFFAWAAAAACLAYWGLRVGVTAPTLPASVQPVSTAMVLRGDVLRLFASPSATAEATPTEPALAARFKLVGVMAPRPGERAAGQGIALIAVDGKPPRPFRVGATVDEALVLQAVARREATLGPAQGPAAVRLELPPLVPAATGSLPPAPSFSPSAAAPAPLVEQPVEPDFVPPGSDPLAPDMNADTATDADLPEDAADDPRRRR